MEYVLIIFLSFGVFDGGATSQHIRFKTEAACSAAKKSIISEFNNPSHGEGRFGRRAIIAVCTAS